MAEISFKCGHPKTKNNIYIDSRGSMICIICKRESQRKYRRAPNYREYRRRIDRIYKKNNRHKFRIYSRNYSKNNPIKTRSQDWAYRQKDYLRDDECNFCDTKIKLENNRSNLEMHHPDYRYPERVITLCVKCHNLVHKKGLNHAHP